MMPDPSSGSATIRAKRVLVPIANPDTALGLLHLAWNLCDHEDGRVFALYVATGNAEVDEDAVEELSAIVAEAGSEGIPVELLTRSASTVARGILDAAGEHGVSLIVLGYEAPERGKATISPVIESVARTTPVDLVVFRGSKRGPLQLEDVKRVVMPLDGSDNSRVAARLGLALAQAYDAEPIAIYVQPDRNLPSWYGMARIEASLAKVDPEAARAVQRQVVHARDVVQGLRARIEPDDLVVIGFSQQSSLDRWIFGDIVQRTLAQMPGPVVVTKQAIADESNGVERLRRRLLAQFSPRLTPAERTEVLRLAAEMSLRSTNFYVLMVLSSLLASLGLLQNSTAVIIGAMLVAPMMSPLMAFAVGLLQGQLFLMRDALLTLVAGVGIGLLVALGLGLVFPIEVATTEMMARGEPSLLDLGVALASGAVGAFAMARKDIPAALAGVAIAAALVPPLCTAGLALAFGDSTLAAGSALLFATNIVSISLAGAAVFVWVGIRPPHHMETMRNWAISVLVLVLLAVPLVRTFVDVVRLEQQTSTARRVLAEQFEPGEVLEVRLTAGDPYEVRATIRSVEWTTSLDVREAQDALREALGHEVALEITNLRAIKP